MYVTDRIKRRFLTEYDLTDGLSDNEEDHVQLRFVENKSLFLPPSTNLDQTKSVKLDNELNDISQKIQPLVQLLKEQDPILIQEGINGLEELYMHRLKTTCTNLYLFVMSYLSIEMDLSH